MRLDRHMRIEPARAAAALSTLGAPTSAVRVDDLALQVGQRDRVVVDDPEGADAGGREIKQHGRTQPAGADHQHARALERAWPGPPTSRSTIALVLIGQGQALVPTNDDRPATNDQRPTTSDQDLEEDRPPLEDGDPKGSGGDPPSSISTPIPSAVSGGGGARPRMVQPLQLEAKEGLALLNGTHMMAGMGALLLHDAWRLLRAAEVAAAMSLEGALGTHATLDPRIHALRRSPARSACAARMRALLRGSQHPTQPPRRPACAGPLLAALHSAGARCRRAMRWPL